MALEHMSNDDHVQHEFFAIIMHSYTPFEVRTLDYAFQFGTGSTMHSQLEKAQAAYFNLSPAELARMKWQNENEDDGA